MNERECETKFHSVSNTNHGQENEVLEMEEPVDLNPSSSSLMVSKVTQRFNGAQIPAFIYTNKTLKAICAEASLPQPIHVSFLNEYDYVLEFSNNFKLHKIM